MASTNGMNSVSEYAQFYNSDNHDRVYDADSMAEWLTPFFVDGVFNGGMQVVATGAMSVNVTPGFAYIDGKVKHFPAVTSVSIDIAHVQYPRIDRIVVRRDDSLRDFFIDVIKGVPAQNPVPPELTRNQTIWELELARITVNAGVTQITQSFIADMRMDKDVCGWVAATVEPLPFDQIKAQYDAFADEYFQKVETDYQTYTENATNRYNLMDEIMTAYQNAQEEMFEAWFQHIKDQLSTDAAGNLQLQIDELSEELRNEAYYYTDQRVMSAMIVIAELLKVTSGAVFRDLDYIVFDYGENYWKDYTIYAGGYSNQALCTF